MYRAEQEKWIGCVRLANIDLSAYRFPVRSISALREIARELAQQKCAQDEESILLMFSSKL